MLISSIFTVYFEDPFWIGIYAIHDQNQYLVKKIIFGKEPQDFEVLHWLLFSFHQVSFYHTLDKSEERKVIKNPKHRLREVKKEYRQIGTKSQIALKKAYLEHKQIKLKETRKALNKEKQRQYEQHKQKRKEKHKGH